MIGGGVTVGSTFVCSLPLTPTKVGQPGSPAPPCTLQAPAPPLAGPAWSAALSPAVPLLWLWQGLGSRDEGQQEDMPGPPPTPLLMPPLMRLRLLCMASGTEARAAERSAPPPCRPAARLPGHSKEPERGPSGTQLLPLKDGRAEGLRLSCSEARCGALWVGPEAGRRMSNDLPVPARRLSSLADVGAVGGVGASMVGSRVLKEESSAKCCRRRQQSAGRELTQGIRSDTQHRLWCP
jgi:hypothetical protein